MKTIPETQLSREERKAMDFIKLIICAGEDISPDAIFVRTRQREIKEARQMIMFFCREFVKGENGEPISFHHIARYVGGMNHATIMSACNNIINWCDTDQDFREKIERYRNKIANGGYDLNVALMLVVDIKRRMGEIKEDQKIIDNILTNYNVIS